MYYKFVLLDILFATIWLIVPVAFQVYICKYIRIKCLVNKLRIGQDDSIKHEKMDIYKMVTKDIKHNWEQKR